jgi:hypothetical protein
LIDIKIYFKNNIKKLKKMEEKEVEEDKKKTILNEMKIISQIASGVILSNILSFLMM